MWSFSTRTRAVLDRIMTERKKKSEKAYRREKKEARETSRLTDIEEWHADNNSIQ